MKNLLAVFLCLLLTYSYGQSLKVISNGNVGIGTAHPTSRLDVVGQVKHSGLRNASDKRLKKNIKPLEQGLKEVLKMTPVLFNYNGTAGLPTEHLHIGMLAQEVQKLVPEMITKDKYYERKNGSDKETSKEYLSMQTDGIQYLLINAIKDQQMIIENQKSLLNDQEERIASLEERLDKIATLLDGRSDIDAGDSKDVILQGEYRLGQNEPNPFRGTTQIPYSIPDGTSNASIEFYGINGALIKSIKLSETRGAINLSQQDLPNGQYSYRLVIDGQTMDSKRMTLIK